MGCNRKNDNDVANVFYNSQKKVRATIDFDDLCRAVRQCLINDLVAAAENDKEDNHKKCHRRRPLL
jgi:Ser/Thr protein kinase RdoA (MazF antagonist)